MALLDPDSVAAKWHVNLLNGLSGVHERETNGLFIASCLLVSSDKLISADFACKLLHETVKG